MSRRSQDDLSKAFQGCIAQHIGVSLEEVLESRGRGSSGNTVGTICLRLGLLSFEQIDAIVDAQPASCELFGETGIRMGFLTREQLEVVLEIQEVHRYVDLGAILLIRGMIELPEYLELMAGFIGERTHAPEGSS